MAAAAGSAGGAAGSLGFEDAAFAPPDNWRVLGDVAQWLLHHLEDHYTLYGEWSGVRSARKHIGWCVHGLPGHAAFRAHMNTLGDAATQQRAVREYFARLADDHELLPQAA